MLRLSPYQLDPRIHTTVFFSGRVGKPTSRGLLTPARFPLVCVVASLYGWHLRCANEIHVFCTVSTPTRWLNGSSPSRVVKDTPCTHAADLDSRLFSEFTVCQTFVRGSECTIHNHTFPLPYSALTPSTCIRQNAVPGRRTWFSARCNPLRLGSSATHTQT